MLDHAFADFKAQVQPGEAGVTLFEAFDDPEGVQVVVESLAEARHLAIQRFLSGVRERGVPNVVRQSQGFGEILVQTQDVGQGARDLRHFDGVGEAVPEMVGKAGSEDLGLRLQAAEGAGMNHAVAVALEGVAVRVFGFGVSPPPASRYWKSQPRQHEKKGDYCCGISPSSVSATCPTLPCRVRNGSSNLRASAGFFCARKRANEMVACSERSEERRVGKGSRSRG